MPIVSIIIPIYNVEKYIKQCLESCINQTYKNFEVIIIDDKSTDQTLSITKNILSSSRINYTIIEKNKRKGVSNSRNLGIKASKGKYIYFLDSDDIIKNNAIEELVTLAECNNYMVVYGKYSRKLSDIESLENFRTSYKLYNISYDDLGALVWAGVIWGGIINSEIIKKNNLYFDESLEYGEDTVFKIDLLCYIDKLVVIDEILYYWRIVKKSLSDNTDIRKQFSREYKLLKIFLLKLNESNNKYKDAILIKMIRVKKNVIYNIINTNNKVDFNLKLLSEIRISLKKILKSNLDGFDKLLEFIYSIFGCFDRYHIWKILYKIKKIY